MVLGNHDIFGHNRLTIERTASETLNKAGVVDIFDEDEEIGLFAGHYENNIEKRRFESEMPVWAIHSYILPDPYLGPHVLIDDFKASPGTKLVMSGHWHEGFPVIRRKDGVLFANPGSLGRTSIRDASHVIQVAVVRRDGERVDVEYVPIRSAKRAELIFDMRQRNRVGNGNGAKGFADSVSGARTSIEMSTDGIDLIHKFARSDDVPKPVVDEAIRQIRQFRETQT